MAADRETIKRAFRLLDVRLQILPGIWQRVRRLTLWALDADDETSISALVIPFRCGSLGECSQTLRIDSFRKGVKGLVSVVSPSFSVRSKGRLVK